MGGKYYLAVVYGIDSDGNSVGYERVTKFNGRITHDKCVEQAQKFQADEVVRDHTCLLLFQKIAKITKKEYKRRCAKYEGDKHDK